MRFSLSPRDNAFYELFTASAANVRDGVQVLAEGLAVDADRVAIAERLSDIEHQGDEHTHTIIRRVNSTFVTPFDREDIYRLAAGLDDVLDDIEATMNFVVLYQVGELPAEIGALADVVGRAADLTAQAMPGLRNPEDLREYWIEVNRLENEGDRVYRRLLADVFSGTYDALTVHKFKDIIETLESAMDGLETVANIVEQIALKES